MLQTLLQNSVLHFGRIDMFLGDFQRDAGVRNLLVSEWFGLSVEIILVLFENLQNVLANWDEFACFLGDHRHEAEKFDVERIVLDTIRQLECAQHELYDGVHEECEFFSVLAKCENPHFEAVVELPRVDGLNSIRIHIIPGVSQMEAKLSNIQESQLVALRQINGEQLREAILGHSQRLLHLMASTARFRLFCEFHVHLLDAILEK